MLAETVKTAPVKSLPDYEFEKTRVWSFYDERYHTSHHWHNTRTDDWATKYATKKQAVEGAKRFETGLRAEEQGRAYVDQFADAPTEWLQEEAARVEARLVAARQSDDFKTRCYLAGLYDGYRRLLTNRTAATT